MRKKVLALALCLGLGGLTALPAPGSLAAGASANPVYQVEVEDGTLNGVHAAQEAAGYSGSGYVTGFDQEADSVIVSFNLEEEALYALTVGYRAPAGAKYAKISANDLPAGEIFLAETAEFAETSGGKLLLKAGANTIRFTNHWGWYDLDYIKLEKTEVSHIHRVTKKLSNPNASRQAKELYRYLTRQYGKAILSGQQELEHVGWIELMTGKKPAIVGFDFMDYSPSRTERGAMTSATDEALAWHRQGGIVTFTWHWNAPTGLIDEPGKEWWRGFYTEATTFDVQYALSHPESEAYRLLIRDIDAIAVQLQRLEDAKVPVLFRPLHEAEGGWFWWGAKGPEPAKELYRVLYDRITRHHGIDNLIWVWNSIDPSWYPGDDIVDIVSTDFYAGAVDHNPLIQPYERLIELARDNKVIALAENGPIPDPDLLTIYGAHWSWFLTWTGDFLTDGKYNSFEHLRKIYNHPYVITLDELPVWRTQRFESGSGH